MPKTLTSIPANPAKALLMQYYDQKQIILKKALETGRALSLHELKKLREIARIMRDVATIIDPQDTKDSIVIIRPQRTGIFLNNNPES